MGKYFKEDNNQRFSKVSSDVNIKTLAENSIRLANWQSAQRFLQNVKSWASRFKSAPKPAPAPAKPKFQMPGSTRERTRLTDEVSLGKLRTPSATEPGKTTYVEKLGRGVNRYVGNKDVKPGIFNQLIASLTNNPVIKLLSHLTLSEFEKGRSAITQILDTAYDIPIVGSVRTQKIELRDLLAQMIRNNNKISVNGRNIDALNAQTYEAIMADIKRLDDAAKRADLYRMIPPGAIVGTLWANSKGATQSQGTKTINQNLINQGLDTNLRTYAGKDLNTFKAMSAPDQQNVLNNISDKTIKKAIETDAKAMGYLK
jgi:hypothetical protein